MMAEIFMVRLEAAVGPVQEKLPSSVPQFVPFSRLVPHSSSSGTKMGLLKVSARSVRAKVSWPKLAAGSTQSRMTQLRHREAKMIEWPRPQKSAVGIHRGCPRHV